MDLIQIFFPYFVQWVLQLQILITPFFCWNWNSWKLGMVLTKPDLMLHCFCLYVQKQ